MTKLYVVITEDDRNNQEMHTVYAQEMACAAMHFEEQKGRRVIAVTPYQAAVNAILDRIEGGE
jgi:hypothetical protein